ncbi:MAG: thioredoxin domain-containing protein [Polyangiaceae bacterium]
MRPSRVALVLAMVPAILSAAVSCVPAPSERPHPAEDAPLPGVDTKDLTPRERHEFSEYVRALPAPCASVAVSLGPCLAQQRPCSACAPAAQFVAQLVREGMAREQVETRYSRRYDPASAKTIPLEGSPSRGPVGARVVVVEFADFECPFCQKMAGTLDEMWEKRKADVRFVYKFMPLPAHPHGEMAARAAIAADMQSKFWAMHHELFSHPHNLEPPEIERYAESIGLNMDRFRADAQSAEATARIEADRKLADTLGVKGTPTLFVDGRECEVPAEITTWVDDELAEGKR